MEGGHELMLVAVDNSIAEAAAGTREVVKRKSMNNA